MVLTSGYQIEGQDGDFSQGDGGSSGRVQNPPIDKRSLPRLGLMSTIPQHSSHQHHRMRLMVSNLPNFTTRHNAIHFNKDIHKANTDITSTNHKTKKPSTTMPRATSRSISPSKQTTTTPRASLSQVLQQLESLQATHQDKITIIKLSEPISTANPDPSENSNLRTSDISNSSLDNPTPASLEADLLHYRELFAKLRFSYVEQVTKEKFIRAIVGDPPLIVTAQENADLEASNLVAKAALKSLKNEVNDMISELETRGKQLAAKYEQVQLDTATLRDLVQGGKIEELEGRISELKAAQAQVDVVDGDDDTTGRIMNLPLAKTALLVEERRAALRDLDRQLEQLERLAPRKEKEVARLQNEVNALETKRANVTAAAREAKRRKENLAQGGVEDDLEAKGRWYRASEVALLQMLGVTEGS
ncbi:hypothetical protein V8F33_000974 [Rhypophila sp. PSN 637]